MPSSALVIGWIGTLASVHGLQLGRARGGSVRMSATPSVGTLYDMPVSNNGARCRMILYYKDISPHEVAIVSPMSLGGLKSTEYLAKNPQGLMPLFVLSEGDEPIPESDTIARFLCNTFATRGPELAPASPVAAARVDKICRHHDLYIAPIQGALYKATGPNMFPPFGRFATRSAAIGELIKQVKALEGMVAPYGGPYLCGSSPTGADCALFPTCCFLMKMLPKFDVDTNDAFGPTLSKWWEHMSTNDPVGVRVYGEIIGALDGWDEKGRWDTIAGAGLRDTASSTLFDKILAKELPADVVYEDEHVLAFRDIAPVAPTHVLLIPKVRAGLTRLQHATTENKFILGHMLSVGVPAIVAAEGLSSYRLVINDGEDACQSVFHLHMHIIGGKKLSWPPGA